jgi:hypothetical protein
MIFRLSQKLNTKIKAGPLESLPLDENPLADWSAQLFVVGRSFYILLGNTKSLFTTVLDGKGMTNASHFIERSLTSIREFTEGAGQESAYRRFIASAGESVRFAKALNRSVTGSMNDMIRHATYWLNDGELSLHEIGGRLNNIPMSALGNGKPGSYGRPRKAFEELLSVEE